MPHQHVCVYVCVYVCVCVCVRACVRACVRVRVCARGCVHIQVMHDMPSGTHASSSSLFTLDR